ncbi:Peptidyl-tRNA hydrolase [Buchnera aphidicola (Periphyllus testudinaceus)]|uniref:aminoacyl-tRNA hydrolase n=1 Tax=Buchnera aphidicola TaxID=9 RepID=UPI003463CF38
MKNNLNKIRAIIGLGNPILKYNKTRHNVGIWYLKSLSYYFNVTFKKIKKIYGYKSEIFFLEKKILLLFPDIFMNLNGDFIYKISQLYNISLDEILIIHDELDLFPGNIKLKYGYGSNGHNGLKSIMRKFKKNTFYQRLSIGIGRPNSRKDISNFVLSKPTFEEKTIILKSINKSIDLIFKKKF